MVKTLVNRIKGLLDESLVYNSFLVDSNSKFSKDIEGDSSDSIFIKLRRGEEVDKDEVFNLSLRNTEHTIISNDFNTLLIQIASMYEVFTMIILDQSGSKEAAIELEKVYFSKEQLALLSELTDRTSRSILVNKKGEIIYKDEGFKEAIVEQVKETTNALLNRKM